MKEKSEINLASYLGIELAPRARSEEFAGLVECSAKNPVEVARASRKTGGAASGICGGWRLGICALRVRAMERRQY